MEKKLPRRIAGVYFVTLGTLMYYFLEEGLYLPMYVSYRQLFAMLIAVSGFVCFLVKPKIAAGSVACRHALVLSVPLFVSFCFTLLVWAVRQTDVAQITRSLSVFGTYTYQIAAAFAAATFLYMFGEKGVWYNLLAMLLANLLMIGRVVLENGADAFVTELIELVASFANNTGSVIIQAEFHELAFCTGLYVFFMLLRPQKKGWYWALFLLVSFCFVVSLKRIAVAAIAIGLLIGWLLLALCRVKHAKQAFGLAMLIMAAVCVALLGYIYAVRAGMFDLLTAIGVDTKGRTEIYQLMSRFYEVSPSFIGQGGAFVQLLFYGEFTTGQMLDVFSTFQGTGISSLHNDFLMYFIELGFFGYITWLASLTLLRVRHFGRRGYSQRGVMTACLMLYVIIISLTDNTLQYPLIYMTTNILIMSIDFDKEVHEEEIRLIGKNRI